MKLRVLQIGKFYPPHRGGIESHLKCLCNELRDKIDLQVVVANDNSRTRNDVVDGVTVARLGSPLDIFSAPVCPSLIRAIRRAAVDLFHLHTPNPGAVMAYLASCRKEPLVITYHSDIVRQKWLGRGVDVMTRLLLDRSSAIIVSSHNYLDSSALLSRYKAKAAVIPLGISVPPLRSRPDSAERIRSRYNRPLVLAAGRLVYYNGFEYLIRAMHRVEAQLLIIGDGPLRSRLERTIRDYSLSERVTLLGNVDDTTPYFAAADLFVLPSIARSEAFGIVQLEAMVWGKPIVNTSLNTGVPFVSPHGLTGLTVPPADADALAHAINLLLERADLRAEFGHMARLRVEREFRKELMADRTLQVYAAATGNTKAFAEARGRM
jgi:glycosyltransferase involved in cell wall biosynthesis